MSTAGTIPIVRCTGTATVNTATVVFGRKSRRCNVTATAATAAGRRASPASRGTDYYKVLSLEHRPDVGAEEIKRAYRRLALQHHPDVCPASRRAESTELFLELRRAYETLSDPARRLRYDADLRLRLRTDGGGEGEGRRRWRCACGPALRSRGACGSPSCACCASAPSNASDSERGAASRSDCIGCTLPLKCSDSFFDS